MTLDAVNMNSPFKDYTRAVIGFIFLILLPTYVRGAFPIVHNFDKRTYGADTQNWDIEQDSLGRMLIANKRGLLIYNGVNWDLHYLGEYGAVRSVAYDHPSRRIFVGGSMDFGFFQPDSVTGILHYKSMLPLLPADKRAVGDIWHIVEYDGYRWFQADHNLYRYDGKNVRVFPVDAKIITSAVIDNTFYLASEQGDLYYLDGSRVRPVPGSAILAGTTIRAIVSHPLFGDKGLVVTAGHGLYTLDESGVARFATELDGFMKEAQLFCASSMEHVLIIGSVNSGVVIKDFRSGETTFLNRETGLYNNTVLSAEFDRNGNIWLGLDNGVAYVLYNSAIKLLLPPSMSVGTGYASALWGSTLILGSNQGLYSIPYPTLKPVQPMRLLSGQVWDISKSGDELFVCTDYGVYTGSPGAMHKIDGIGGAWCIRPLNKTGDLALVASYDKFYIVSRQAPGRWVNLGPVSGFDSTTGKFRVDSFGKIWLTDWKKGLYRLTIDVKKQRFSTAEHFSTANGLPSNQNTGVTILQDLVLISTQRGFASIPILGNKVKEARQANKYFRGEGSFHVYVAPDGAFWAISPEKILRAYNEGGKILVDSSTYNPVHIDIVPGFDHITFLCDTAILSGESGFYELIVRKQKRSLPPASLFVAKVYLDNDSLLQSPGNGISDLPSSLPYNASSISFSMGCTEYRQRGAVKYSFYLEDYDKEWSPYSTSASKEYTRLGYGDYTLHVRAIDTYDNSKMQTSYSFRVETPWYFSLPARIIYAILTIAALTTLSISIHRLAQKKARKMEERKELEISELKQKAFEDRKKRDEEIEKLATHNAEQALSHRNESLSKAAKQTVQKNEILRRISSQIEKIKAQADGNLTENLTSVQETIRRSLSRSGDLSEITKDFDEVYDDYVTRLTSNYPSLTKTEIRLCCYIKMGLSSKEIAQLLDVAVKSVEMSRYRLRKKLKLERSDNLSVFLQQF